MAELRVVDAASDNSHLSIEEAREGVPQMPSARALKAGAGIRKLNPLAESDAKLVLCERA